MVLFSRSPNKYILLFEKYVDIFFVDLDTGEQYDILGEKLSWRLRHGWYVLTRESGFAEDEDPIPYAINASWAL